MEINKKTKENILLNVLHEAQDKYGYISENLMKQISEDYQVPISRLYGMAKFYTKFRTEKQGDHILELCGSPSCILNKARKIEKFLQKKLKIGIGETTKDKKFSLFKTSCIGCCDEAPAMLIDGMPYTNLTVKRVKKILKELKKEDKK